MSLRSDKLSDVLTKFHIPVHLLDNETEEVRSSHKTYSIPNGLRGSNAMERHTDRKLWNSTPLCAFPVAAVQNYWRVVAVVDDGADVRRITRLVSIRAP